MTGFEVINAPTAVARVPSRPFTGEQRGAIADRRGSRLLSANAGSGKTAVMVERFVEAVMHEEAGVGQILALTFTEKAAGELRERLRHRFAELGQVEHAREADGAWVGTIHGFCARVLRSEPLSAGLDPRFEVLDEAAAGRLADNAFDDALEGWAARHGEPALALAGAYGAGLKTLLLETHAELRSGGQTRPALPVPPSPPVPDANPLRLARSAAATVLSGARDGAQVEAARAALAAAERMLDESDAGSAVPTPGQLAPARRGGGRGAALAADDCESYRQAFDAYHQACADHHARAALVLLDDLLGRFSDAYAAAKAARGAVDFADLELCARDLFATDAAARDRWSRRFALIMVDEFQDTNRVQLDVLEAIERDNLFAVGDELQSIYGFRHADVMIFRERRAALGDGRVRRLTANFRSREELLDVLNGAFAPVFTTAFAPLRAGRAAAPGAAQPAGPRAHEPAVDLLLTDSAGWDERAGELGLAGLAPQPWRRAEARLLAERLGAELSSGRRPGDLVVLVRATGSLRLFEQALEERGIPTYVLGGRGYWSHEQVRDGLAYLAALANPLDEPALLGALASPFCGVGADALILLAGAAREGQGGLWPALRAVAFGSDPLTGLSEDDRARLRRFGRFFAAERRRAERLSPETLLERAVAALGYDVAILARAGGDRRMANLRKLMRLARDYDAAEGRDLRGFVTFATGQDLREAREGEAPLEAEDLDAVRLMTIHRAKGLEFPVVAVADLGRQGNLARSPLLTGRDGRIGLKLAALGGGDRVDALHYRALAEERAAAEDQEERRLLYVAMTRAQDKLIVSGGLDLDAPVAARPGGPPIAWVAPALVGDLEAACADPAAESPLGAVVPRGWDGRATGVRLVVSTAGGNVLAMAGPPASPAPVPVPRPGSPPPRAAAGVAPQPRRAGSAGRARLSFTALQAYQRCPYRFYLQRVLGLPDDPVGQVAPGEQMRLDPEPPGLEARVRGVVVHRLLELLDFARPQPADPARVMELLAEEGVQGPSAAEADEVGALVAAFAASPLRARLAAAPRVRREAPFACAPRPGSEPLITGVLDVYAEEADGGVLVVDYKTNRLAGLAPAEVVEHEYALQRSAYALAALSAGAPRVEVAYCFLERPGDVVGARFDPTDMPALAEEVLAASAGVMSGRWPVAETPHRQLCGTCPGRRALCSHPETLTLRELAEAVPQLTGAGSESGRLAGDWAGSSPAGSGSSSTSGADADTEL